MADIDNKGTALLSLTAVLTADHETLKARIAGWSQDQCQEAIDWAVARLVNAPEPEVATHVAPFLAVRESASACQCASCRLARTARQIVNADPGMAEAHDMVRQSAASTLCLAASQKAAIQDGIPRRVYANVVLKHGGENLLHALAEEKVAVTGTPAGATKH